jgi:hypothetical protein
MDFGNLDDWKTDPRAYTTGVPLDLGNGRALHIKRAGTVSREFVSACAARQKAGLDPDDPDEQMSLYARVVVAGWSGIVNSKGEAVPFSAEACIELFRAYPEIWAAVWPFANSRSNFRVEEMDEDKAQVKLPLGGAKARANTQAH